MSARIVASPVVVGAVVAAVGAAVLGVDPRLARAGGA
jgi:hypothetical protein